MAKFEKQRIEEFTNEEIRSQPETMASMQQRVHEADQATGMKSAIVYLMVQSEEGAEQGIDIVVIPGEPQYPPIHRFQPVNLKELSKEVNNFRAGVTNAQRAKAFKIPAQRLHYVIIRPITEILTNLGVNHLHLVVDHELQVIPMSALSNGSEFLIERFSLSVSPSFSLTQTTPLNQEEQEVTALGETKFDHARPLSGAGPEVIDINNIESVIIPEEFLFHLENLKQYLQEQGFEPTIQAQLENSLVHLNRIQRILGKAVRYPQELEKVNEALQVNFGEKPASQILHIATHGLARGGDKSFLTTRPGKITIKDLLEMDFSAIEMVVFSACQTIIDDSSNSPPNLDQDQEFGISGAILQQGAESAIGSFWQVSDMGTMAMMKTFYQILSEKRGLTRAQVLQEAQLAMMEGRVEFRNNYLVYKPKASAEQPNPKPIVELLPKHLPENWNQTFEHPYFWSAFELVGNAY